MGSRRHRSGNNFVWPSAFDDLLWRTGTPTRTAAAWLNRTPRTVHDWRTGRRPVPRWAFQLVKFLAWDRFETWRADLHLWRYRPAIDLREIWPDDAGNAPAAQSESPAQPVPDSPPATAGPTGVCPCNYLVPLSSLERRPAAPSARSRLRSGSQHPPTGKYVAGGPVATRAAPAGRQERERFDPARPTARRHPRGRHRGFHGAYAAPYPGGRTPAPPPPPPERKGPGLHHTAGAPTTKDASDATFIATANTEAPAAHYAQS